MLPRQSMGRERAQACTAATAACVSKARLQWRAAQAITASTEHAAPPSEHPTSAPGQQPCSPAQLRVRRRQQWESRSHTPQAVRPVWSRASTRSCCSRAGAVAARWWAPSSVTAQVPAHSPGGVLTCYHGFGAGRSLQQSSFGGDPGTFGGDPAATLWPRRQANPPTLDPARGCSLGTMEFWEHLKSSDRAVCQPVTACRRQQIDKAPCVFALRRGSAGSSPLMRNSSKFLQWAATLVSRVLLMGAWEGRHSPWGGPAGAGQLLLPRAPTDRLLSPWQPSRTAARPSTVTKVWSKCSSCSRGRLGAFGAASGVLVSAVVLGGTDLVNRHSCSCQDCLAALHSSEMTQLLSEVRILVPNSVPTSHRCSFCPIGGRSADTAKQRRLARRRQKP